MNYEQNRHQGPPAAYRIQVQGWIAPRWRHWFEDLELAAHRGDEGIPLTILTGTVVDQAELRGILNKLWDLNLTLMSVTRLLEPAAQKDRAAATQGGKADE